MDNLNYVLYILQNEPIGLVILAAIALILAILILFPAIIRSLPFKKVNQDKGKHRRPLFLVSIFVVLAAVVLAILLIPGIRGKVGNFLTDDNARPVRLIYIYANVKGIDKENSTVTITDSTNQVEYSVKIDKSTLITRGDKDAGISDINIGESITVTTKRVPEKESEDNTVFPIEIFLMDKSIKTL